MAVWMLSGSAISIAGPSESAAEDVLAAKIVAEVQPGAGREFAQVIPRVTDLANTYILKHVDHWESYIPELRPFPSAADS